MRFTEDAANPRLRRKLATVLAVVGSVAYVLCALRHLCMGLETGCWRHGCSGGHMTHQPYPWWDYAIDFVWVASFALAAVLATKANLYRAGQFIGLIGFLLVSRGVLASDGGVLFLLEIPALLALLFLAVIGFLQPPDRSPVPLPPRDRTRDRIHAHAAIKAPPETGHDTP